MDGQGQRRPGRSDPAGRHAAVPSTFDIAWERLRRLTWRTVAGICVLAGIAAATLMVWDEVTLDLDHATATAEVTGIDDSYHRGPPYQSSDPDHARRAGTHTPAS